MRTDGHGVGRVASLALLLAAAGFLTGCNGSLFVQNQAYAPYAAPPGYTPDDTYYDLQWHYDLIDVPAAWAIMREAFSAGGPPRTPQTVRVAVIDTGIREHEDLDPSRLVDGYDIFAYDSDPTDPVFSQTKFHGTHVTGTLLATTANGLGVSGIGHTGASALVEVLPIRALSTAGTSFDLAMAVLYAVGLDNLSGQLPSEPASVINISLGQTAAPNDRTLKDAIQAAVDAGATVVAAAGNDGDSFLRYPAMYDNTIAVGAIRRDGGIASYSNFSPSLDFVAPGGEVNDGVWSTWEYPCSDPDGLFDEPIQGCSSGEFVDLYATQAGTSMATPHVAGVVALLYSYASELTQDVVYDILLASVDDAGDPGHDEFYGHGIVNARAALEYLIRATDDYGVAPILGDGTDGDGTAGDAAGDGGSAGTARAGSGPMGRPILQREGAFLPAAAANVGIDYDAGSVVLALWEENLAPGEVAAARSIILDAIEGVTEIDGEDSQRLRARLVAGADPEEVIRDLAAHPEVRYAQPNYLYTVPAGRATPAAYPAGR